MGDELVLYGTPDEATLAIPDSIEAAVRLDMRLFAVDLREPAEDNPCQRASGALAGPGGGAHPENAGRPLPEDRGKGPP